MGGRVSRISSSRSDQISKPNPSFPRECKVFVLGYGQSGKSAILTQMKIVHQNGLSHDELESYRPIIYKRLLDSTQALVLTMRKIGVEPENNSNIPLVDKIENFRLDTILPQEITDAIDCLWQDPVIPKVMDEFTDSDLIGSTYYFLSAAQRIGSPGYLPTEEDILRASTGVSSNDIEMQFSMGQMLVRMIDVDSQQLEHENWTHGLEEATAIVFCVALSEYDQVLSDGSSQSHLAKSLVLFESVVNSPLLQSTAIILFLNKIDVFKNKIQNVPLERYFPEYTGGHDINKAAKFILWKFMQLNRGKLPIYPHLTQVTDTANIRLVFAAVKETMLQKILKDGGILE